MKTQPLNYGTRSQLFRKAMEKLIANVDAKGHEVTNITLTKRFNPQTGVHVHASTRITVRIDESVSDADMNQEVA